MAYAARLAFNHIVHGGFAYDSFVGEILGVAIFAPVCLGMESVTESCRGNTFNVESDFFGFQSFVAAVAVGCDGKCFFTVMTCPAGASFLHLGHCYRFFLAGYDLAVVTAPAGSAGFCNMCCVAEHRCAESFDIVRNIAWFSCVTAHAVFFSRYAECFYTAVACTAGFGFFHFSHGKMLSAFEAVDSVMAYSAVVVVFFKMKLMAEYNWVGILEFERDIFCFDSAGAYDGQ